MSGLQKYSTVSRVWAEVPGLSYNSFSVSVKVKWSQSSALPATDTSVLSCLSPGVESVTPFSNLFQLRPGGHALRVIL